MATTKTTRRLLTPRFGLVVMVGLAYFLSLGILWPVVPNFVEEKLQGGAVAVGIVVGSFSIGAIVLRTFAGRVGDRLGRKVLIVSGALVVGVSTALYHFVPGTGVFVAMRVLGGVGEAAFFVGAGTMVTDLAPEERRGEAISYWSVAVYGGLSFGPYLGEYLRQNAGYGVVWTVAASFAFAAAALGLLTRETLTPDRRVPKDAPRAPLLYPRSFAPGLVLFLGMVGLAGFFEFIPLYVDDIGVPSAGPVLLMYGLAILAIRIAGARLPDMLGPLRAGTGATAFGAAGLLVIAAVPRPAGLYAGALIFAVGMSLLYPAMLTLALSGVPEAERGACVGTVSSFFDASQGLGAMILGGAAAISGYRGSFVAGSVFAIAGLVLLRSGIDPRARRAVDHEAATVVAESPEPEQPWGY
ncbi:MAG: MFS transporter [Actinobacteria bacterium]|nr:MFS transporter [Actinomycetota bacterium]